MVLWSYCSSNWRVLVHCLVGFVRRPCYQGWLMRVVACGMLYMVAIWREGRFEMNLDPPQMHHFCSACVEELSMRRKSMELFRSNER